MDKRPWELTSLKVRNFTRLMIDCKGHILIDFVNPSTFPSVAESSSCVVRAMIIPDVGHDGMLKDVERCSSTAISS